MKSIIKQKTMILGFMAVTILAIIAYGCAEEQKFEVAPADNPTITQLTKAADELRTVRNAATFGKKKGMYPLESRSILDNAIVVLSRLVVEINAGKAALAEADITQAVNAGKSAETQFKATVLLEDIPWDGKPAELYVDGLNSGYIDFGGEAGYTKFPDQQATVEFWIRMTKVRDGMGALVSAFRENGGDRTGWLINYLNYDFLRVTYAFGDGSNKLFEEGTGYRVDGGWDNKTEDNLNSPWLHVAFVYNDNGKGKFYLNGRLLENRVIWDINDRVITPDYSPYLNMTAFVQRSASGELSRPIAGYMKHFRIWKKAKTETEVNELMNGKEVTGSETDLVSAWPFDETVENDKEIIDLTGKCTAALRGRYRWEVKDE